MEAEVLPRFLECELLEPMIETTPLGRGAFTLYADAWRLEVIYKPSFQGEWVSATIRDRVWWEAPAGVREDQMEYLAVRLAAELREEWNARG